MSYRDHLRADRRLCILRALDEQTDVTLNETILSRVCESYGHRVGRDVIRADLRWLDEVGAVTVSEVGDYLVARLTGRGEDHVQRRTAIDGIARPRLD